MPSWFQQVSTTTIQDVVHRKQVLIEVEVSKSIESALQLMQEHDVTAVAVCQPLTDGGPKKIVYCGMEYIGIISVVDVFAYVIQHDVPFLEVLNRSVSEIIGMSEESANFWVEAPKNPLYFAMEKFIDHGCHRALVFDCDHPNNAPKMISQTDIVRYIAQHNMALPHLSKAFHQTTVGQAASAHVEGVRTNLHIRDALPLLIKHSAVPVLDYTDLILGTLSGSDLRRAFDMVRADGSGHRHATSIWDMNVENFLRAINGGVMPDPMVCSPLEALKTVVENSLQRHVHRVWVTNDKLQQQQPGHHVHVHKVLTLTDIIRVAFNAELDD